MDITNLEEAGKKIEEKLSKIRERLGVPPIKYSVGPKEIEISGGDLAKDARTDPDKPIIREGEFHMAFIRDNSYYDSDTHDENIDDHPNQCFTKGNKVHFYHCTTLVDMQEQRRGSRYRVARKIENERIIDLDNKKNLRTRLALCKHCIKILCNNGDINSYPPDKIAGYGDAEELMVCVKAYYNDGSSAIPKIQSFIENTISFANQKIKDYENTIKKGIA